MPVPKRHHTHSRKKMASAGKAIHPKSHSICPQCQSPKPPHVVCPSCGYYNKRQILRIEES